MKRILFLLMFSIGNMWVFSQNTFNFATTNDDIFNTSNVDNTGNDAVKLGITSSDMRATIDDGDDASFVWSIWDGSNVTTSGVVGLDSLYMNDPDVVLGESGYHSVVVYENQGYIYAMKLQYNGTNWYVSIAPVSIGRGYHPNIDIDAAGTNMVACWDYQGNIRARYLEMSLALSQPVVTICSAITDADYDYPDVTLCTYTSTYVTICYRETKSNGNQQIIAERELLTAISGNNLTNTLVGLRFTSTDAIIFENFGHPRIASPATPSTVSASQNFTVVVDRLDYDANNNLQNSYIEYSNCYLGTVNCYDYTGGSTYPPLNLIISPGTPSTDITDSPNSNPVVAYCGDNVLISWQYYDQQGYTNNNGWEILQRKIGVDGSPSFPYFSVVNYDLDDDQTIPSISGRFTFSSDAFYCFYTTLQSNVGVGYKSSNVGNYNLRKPKLAETICVYPTISSQIITIKSNEIITKIDIYDENGKNVYSIQNPTNNELDIQQLLSGVYLISIQTNSKLETKKIIKN